MKARRWSDTAAFRADPSAAPADRPSQRQVVALLVVLLLVAGAVVAASYLVRPDKARAFALLHGSVFLEDSYAPVGIDLATGKPTVRLVDAVKQVGATANDQLSVIPAAGATLLLNNGTDNPNGGADNPNSGEFNEVDETGFVMKTDGSGVPLNPRSDKTRSMGFAETSGKNPAGSAYIERTGPGGTDVFLVSESTVALATDPTKPVQARASISLPAEIGTVRPGAGASANGDLWVVLKSSGKYALRQLHVPANSKSGVRLDNIGHGAVDGTAAIGVARQAGSDSVDVVGVAEPSRIVLYRSGVKPEPIPISGLRGVDTILSATNEGDRLDYLVHSSVGWSAFSVGADGQNVQQPVRLSAIPSDVQLAQPTQSSGALYSLDKTNGVIYRITQAARTVQATPVAPYPKQRSESASLGDAYLLGYGPRVIVNSPGHSEALVLFTDGSRAPLIVRKAMAVNILASSNATAFTENKVKQTDQRSTKQQGGGAIARSQPISTRVDCKTVNQKPHIPTITGATPGSRSVALSWTYPLLDQEDCAPSTYVVSVKLLSNDAPQPDGSVTVQGQQSVNLAGLYPSSRYQLTVTAYLNKLSTPSQPVTVTTGPEGPAAPTGVQASADSAGNWTVQWNACGSIAHGCVPATTWRVIPNFCDGVGLSSAPTPLTVPADPSTTAQPPALFKGSDDLLGRGLQFQIQGTGAMGQAGTPSAKSACVYSWTNPNVAAMTLHASTPANTTLGGTSSTNVTLNLGADPTRAVGGYGAKITISLSGDGTTQTKSFTFNGNQSTLAVTFGGVRSGAVYTASAMVTPAHGGSMATVAPVRVTTRANWPAISMSAHCDPTGLLTCTLSVNLSGLSSADARGERFTFDGDLTCGSTVQHISAAGIDPAAGPITVPGLDQRSGYYGDCTVSGTLHESSNASPLVFGGSVYTVPSVHVTLPGPTLLNAGAGDFSVGWDGQNVTIRYTGAADLDALTTNSGWSEAVDPPGAGPCANGSAQPPTSVFVTTDCIQAHGAVDGWQVNITYTDVVGGKQHTVGPLSLDKPPTYTQPPPPPKCTPDNSQFNAAWGATLNDPITVTYGGSADSIGPCTHWSYSLKDATGAAVCSGSTASNGPPPATVSYTGCTPAAGWQVEISWQDTDGNAQSKDVAIPGDPPTS